MNGFITINTSRLLSVSLSSENRIFDKAPWTGDRPITGPVLTQENTEKPTHTSMPRAGFNQAHPAVEENAPHNRSTTPIGLDVLRSY
jgi:hypothetical protein